MSTKGFQATVLGVVIGVIPMLSMAEQLSLRDLELQVLQNDKQLQGERYQIEATQQRAMAAGELPDPRLSLKAANLPTDSFNLSQEPMTQAIVGVQQKFPGKNRLRLQSQQLDQQAVIQQAQLHAKEVDLLRQVRQLWLQGWGANQGLALLEEQEQLLTQDLQLASDSYSTGRASQQSIIEVRLALSQLQEQSLRLRSQQKTVRVQLQRWLREADQIDWPDTLPQQLSQLPTQTLDNHPELQALWAKQNLRELDLALAEEDARPDWALEASYGWREDRADFISVGIHLGLPWLTKKRQDWQRKAAGKAVSGAQLYSKDRQEDLQAQWLRHKTTAISRQQQIETYDEQIIPEREAIVQLAKASYQHGQGALNLIVQADIEIIRAQHNRLELQLEQALAIIELLYLSGARP